MSQMDDIEKAIAENPEFKAAVEKEGQALQDAGVTHDSSLDNQSADNSSNANTNEDPAMQYRSELSDVGNMDGKQIPDASGQEVTADNQSSANLNPDSSEQENMTLMDREEAGVEKSGFADKLSQERESQRDEPSPEPER